MADLYVHDILAFVVLAWLALMTIACTGSNPAHSVAGGGGTNGLTGAGSTFINPAMSQWAADFGQQNKVRINYQSIGSGGGIQQLKKGLVDFGASDAALDDKALGEMPPVVQIAESAGPVCITYNLPNLGKPLRLSDTTLAGIFLGKIMKWNDPAIKKDNPDVNLPNLQITVAHRSDGSGTTNIFTTYLSQVDPEWDQKVGKGISVSWPAGVGGKGSEGVTGVVKQAPGAIGYVELTYAKENNLPVAEIRNKAGNYELPTAQGTTDAIEAFSTELSKDVRVPIVNPPAAAKDAYPIAGLTFVLVPKDGDDTAKRQNLKDFLQFVITNGQETATKLNYAALPKTLVAQDQTLLGQMKANGQALR
ncbi:MAG TPA: phosphate ABC transporter substrate-binding protein PstS [Terriglobales bacterium]|nr:phosphate ABC transporter substrate-binding protein PstS [Terriglobales bacterium]